MHPASKRTEVPAILESDFPQFYVGTLHNSIPDGSSGIEIDVSYVQNNPILRSVTRNGVVYHFVAVNPFLGWSAGVIRNSDPIISFRELVNKGRGVPNYSGSITALIGVYAEWTSESNEIREIFEGALDAESDSPQFMERVFQLLTDGLSCSCEFIDILRRKFSQYWLTYPESLSMWSILLYFSKPRGSWHEIYAGDGFVERLKKPFTNLTGSQLPRKVIILKTLRHDDFQDTNAASPVEPFSFAEEMISTALVDLSQIRTRSAIVHAVIALESTAKKCLEKLLTERLTGLEQGRILEAISKEISTVTLARVVYGLLIGEAGVTRLDWPKITQLYDLRNTIIHKNRRRLPDFEQLKDWLVEVFRYVQIMEEKLREFQDSGESDAGSDSKEPLDPAENLPTPGE